MVKGVHPVHLLRHNIYALHPTYHFPKKKKHKMKDLGIYALYTAIHTLRFKSLHLYKKILYPIHPDQ